MSSMISVTCRTATSTRSVRQVKYLNNLVEQDHRAIKRIILRDELGFEMNTHLLALGNGSSAVS